MQNSPHADGHVSRPAGPGGPKGRKDPQSRVWALNHEPRRHWSRPSTARRRAPAGGDQRRPAEPGVRVQRGGQVRRVPEMHLVHDHDPDLGNVPDDNLADLACNIMLAP